MPSISLTTWRTIRSQSLGRVELAHRAITANARGHQDATRQLNQAYALLLAAEFQGFCRELHTEAVGHLVAIVPPSLQQIVRSEFAWSRGLDRGNANSMTLGTDFRRLGIDLWKAVDAAEPRGPDFRRRLEELNAWRNAIAHSDFDAARLGGRITLAVATVRRWRRTLQLLAATLDLVVADHIRDVTGNRPWT